MDSSFGLKGSNFVIICSDAGVAHSVLQLKDNEDKIYTIDDHVMMSASGESSDRPRWANFLGKNIQLQKYRTGHTLNVSTIATYARSQLAIAIRSRSGAFQVDSLLGGVDETGGHLYYLDYLGTMTEVDKAGHGYAGYFVSSILDNYWDIEMDIQTGIEVIKKCIQELKTRFVINNPKFITKIVDKDGIKLLDLE